MVRGLGPRRRFSAGPYPAAARGDENAPPPDGFNAALSTSGATGPGAASRLPFHPRAIRPPLASSSSMYNRKPQLPAPTPKKVSGVRAAGNTPARQSVARTSLELTKKPSFSLLRRSVDVLPFKVKESISFWEGEVNYKNSLSKYAPVTPANLEACSDEGFMRNTETKLILELEWDILKTILVEELKSRAEVEDRTAALGDELKEANFRMLEACKQKEAIQEELNGTRDALESDLFDLIQESKKLKKANDKSLELLQERDMEIQRLNSELEKANFNKKHQQDHVSCSSAEQEKNDVSRQVQVQTKLITYLATEQSSIQLQLEASKNNELLAKQNLGEIELLLDEAIETIMQKEVLAQNYASLLESQQEQSKSYYEGRFKELETMMQEMNDQVAASLIARNKEIRKTHAEEKNEILKQNEVLERSIEDLRDDMYFLEEEAKKFKEDARQQRREREKLEIELHNLRQQSLVARSSGKAEFSLKDGMTNLADSTRVLSYRNNELLCSHVSPRICRKEASDKESVVAEQLDGEMAQPHLSHEEYQPESSQFEHPSPAEQPELYSNGTDSDQAPSESEAGEQVPPQALKPIIEVVEEKELPPLAPVQDRKPLDYALAPSDELKRLRTINHYEGQRTATDRRFWSIEQQDLYSSIYKSAKIFEMKWIDWEHIRSVDQFAGIRERCAFLGLEQIMGYRCAWDTELIRQFYSTVHISTDKSSITWMTNGRKITTNKRAWEELFGIPCGVHSEIHTQFWLDDDDKRILYTAADCTIGQISGLSPLTIIAKKIVWSTIYPRSGNNIDGHNWNLLYHIVKQQPFDVIALLFGEIDLIISGRNGLKDLLFYAPYIMGMIMSAFEYDGSRESRHNSYKPRPSYNYKQKRRNRFSCPPTPAVAAPSESPLSAFQPEIVVDVDADNHHQFDTAGHKPQGDNRHTNRSSGCGGHRLRPIRHSLADVSAQPAFVRPSPFGRFPWYQREK
ncbi:hypothetical protein BDA96_08G164700 [Sorghum bicolor]|uniref:Uncharacterized protein n=1 Tax=Sorghum bicolor TaxID=4558 RepID=A0A921U7T9_SORBI|nr:hypothetical protein BDA96_08G164700 [Sorghum bicolor]